MEMEIERIATACCAASVSTAVSSSVTASSPRSSRGAAAQRRHGPLQVDCFTTERARPLLVARVALIATVPLRCGLTIATSGRRLHSHRSPRETIGADFMALDDILPLLDDAAMRAVESAADYAAQQRTRISHARLLGCNGAASSQQCRIRLFRNAGAGPGTTEASAAQPPARTLVVTPRLREGTRGAAR
jgi:hypothetical protein